MAVTISTSPVLISMDPFVIKYPPVGYVHEIVVNVALDGTMSPAMLNLGNIGDLNITQVRFDTSALTTAGYDLTNDYKLNLIVYKPGELRSTTNPTNPTTYELPTSGIWVAPTMMQVPSQPWQIILALSERGNSTHTTTQTELWVSKTIQATYHKTAYDSSMSLQLGTIFANEPPTISADAVDTFGYLVKPPIIIAPSSDFYGIVTNNTVLGQKFDNRVRRLQFIDTSWDEGFKYFIGFFTTLSPATRANINILQYMTEHGTAFYHQAVVFQKITAHEYGALIPTSLLQQTDPIYFTLVAQTENVPDQPQIESDGLKRWVSNEIVFTVENNFLTSEDIPAAEPLVENNDDNEDDDD